MARISGSVTVSIALVENRDYEDGARFYLDIFCSTVDRDNHHLATWSRSQVLSQRKRSLQQVIARNRPTTRAGGPTRNVWPCTTIGASGHAHDDGVVAQTIVFTYPFDLVDQ